MPRSRGPRRAGPGASHAEAGKNARLAQGAERRNLVADRRDGAVARVDLRARRKGHHALEASLHLLAVPARKVPPAGAASEDDVAREEHVLAPEIEAGRALGVTRRVERRELEIRDEPQHAFVEKVVGIARGDLERRGRALGAEPV